MIGIIGSGGWGTALAKVCADKGHQVYIWALEPEVVMEINQQHTNHTFLPGVELVKWFPEKSSFLPPYPVNGCVVSPNKWRPI